MHESLDNVNTMNNIGRQANAPSRDNGAHPRLSLCMIVKDEQDTLPGALESVAGLADEIIVVDTGSTDGTVAVAERLGAKVRRFPWNDDFSEARNASIGYASADWILILDADERLSAEGKAAVTRLMREGEHDAYTCRIVSLGIGRDASGRFENYMTRLVRNVPGVRFHGRIHEQLLTPSGRVGVAPDVIIEHLGYSDTAIAWKRKNERNLALHERVLAENPDDLFARFNLGNHYYALGDYEKAFEHLKIVCDLGPKNLNYVVSAHVLAVESLMQLGKLDEAYSLSTRAISAFPDLTDVEFTRGNVCLKLGRLAEAEERFRKIVEGKTTEHIGIWDCTIKSWKAHKALGIVLLRQQRFAEAQISFREALAARPGDADIEVFEALCAVAQGDDERALAVAEKAVGLQGSSDATRTITADIFANVGVRRASAGKESEAVELFRQALEANPKHVLSLHWMGKIAVRHGDFSRAREYLTEALSMSSENPRIAEDLAWVCLKLGDAGSAAQAIAPLAEKGTDVSAMLLYARALMESGDIAGSLKEIIRVTEADPDSEEAYFLMALDFSALGKHFEAMEILLRLIEVSPKNPNYLRTFAHVARKTGNFEAARDAEEYAGKIR